MQLTRNQLRKFIYEAISEIGQLDEDELVTHDNDLEIIRDKKNESYMAKANLDHIARYAQSLHDMLPDDYALEDWAENKISISRAYISDVKHYIEYKFHKNKRLERVPTKNKCG